MSRLAFVACAWGATAALAFGAQDPWRGRPRPAGPVVTTLDVDGDGTISATELQSAPTALRQLDVDRDGIVAATELRPAIPPDGRRGGTEVSGGESWRGGPGAAPAAGQPMSADGLTQTLMGFDGNGDGSLVRSEVPERFQGLFDRVDTDRDGALTRDEVQQGATASMQASTNGEGAGGRARRSGRGRGLLADPLLAALDADRNGALSTDEVEGATIALAALDANRDGQLTAEEFQPVAPGARDGQGARR